jgi:hypothetical protein
MPSTSFYLFGDAVIEQGKIRSSTPTEGLDKNTELVLFDKLKDPRGEAGFTAHTADNGFDFVAHGVMG